MATPARAPASNLRPASFAGAFAYEHTDIPPGVTLDDHRRRRNAQAARRKAQRRAGRQRRVRALLSVAGRAATARRPGEGSR